MSAFFDAPIAVGKHTVCPFAKPTSEGEYAACVSIRGGQGRSSVDHVLRFVPLFGDAQAACRYAIEQAMLYLNAPAASSSTCA
ncbi:hypothetical protein AACH06_19520 [Ideonella sp. DXS29W]|uniref:DUF1488 family protein n=1 Tax=Ideonella lacteola TaxID=2984193 RepID=A0ABU9BU72_9BURK